MRVDNPSFWSTLPGILTAAGAFITAIGGLIGVLYSAGVFGRKREKDGPAKSAASPEPPQKPVALPQLRSAPAVLTWEKIDAMLVRNGLFDKVRNPSGRGVAHQYTPQVREQVITVTDAATSLMWQKGGSSAAMPFDAAAPHVDSLNSNRHAGFADWRVPTLEEAMTLMAPAPTESAHIDPVFQRGVNFIWTADQTSKDTGFVVYFYDGCVAEESKQFNAHVRAVRSIA